ncbi:hypothetical protein CDL12_21021 [Handroanthus impetiginosus]|uniref:Uncharacterized protein n=1 Tax=Handroanthus impetiginosus TaxID=429701 RepID=A0A2G9GMD3_9LAMI|nr:hypothetical protein CDL12_21021 [Handroanthus impetiginosus]
MENNGRQLEARKGAWTKEEDDLLKKCIEQHGEGKWHQVPLRAGRTANDIKNFWNTHIEKHIKSVGAGLGGETEKCTRAKIITKSNIIRPLPRTFSKLPGCPSTTDHQRSKTNNENPKDKLQPSSSTVSLSQDQDTINGWTNDDPDECIRWWSSLLEITETGEPTPLSFSDEDYQIILSPGLGDAIDYTYQE